MIRRRKLTGARSLSAHPDLQEIISHLLPELPDDTKSLSALVPSEWLDREIRDQAWGMSTGVGVERRDGAFVVIRGVEAWRKLRVLEMLAGRAIQFAVDVYPPDSERNHVDDLLHCWVKEVRHPLDEARGAERLLVQALLGFGPQGYTDVDLAARFSLTDSARRRAVAEARKARGARDAAHAPYAVPEPARYIDGLAGNKR